MINIRSAGVADIPVLARQRAGMFRDMGSLDAGLEAALIDATADYLGGALPRGEYLGWIAESREPPVTVGGVGVQLRPILPRPGFEPTELELGPEAIVLSMYVEPSWRRRGVGEALMRAALGALGRRCITRVVLHASDAGRALYERLGFVATNEMRLTAPPGTEE